MNLQKDPYHCCSLEPDLLPLPSAPGRGSVSGQKRILSPPLGAWGTASTSTPCYAGGSSSHRGDSASSRGIDHPAPGRTFTSPGPGTHLRGVSAANLTAWSLYAEYDFLFSAIFVQPFAVVFLSFRRYVIVNFKNYRQK